MSDLHKLNDPSASIENSPIDLKETLLRNVIEATRTLGLQLQSFDHLLWEIDQLLNDLQPPQNGKIRLFQSPKDPGERYRPEVWKRNKKTNDWYSKQVGWPHLSLRAKKSRAFNDNFEAVKGLLDLAMEVNSARSSLYRAYTNYTQACSQRMVHASPRGTDFRQRVNVVKRDRDAGRYFTFITGHKPVREGFEAS